MKFDDGTLAAIMLAVGAVIIAVLNGIAQEIRQWFNDQREADKERDAERKQILKNSERTREDNAEIKPEK